MRGPLQVGVLVAVFVRRVVGVPVTMIVRVPVIVRVGVTHPDPVSDLADESVDATTQERSREQQSEPSEADDLQPRGSLFGELGE